MKTCTECGFPKDDSEFDRTPRRQCLKSRCQECTRRKLSVGSRAWQLRNPEKAKAVAYKSRYNIDFDDLWQAQNGLCALCHEAMLREGVDAMSVAVDHDRSCCPGKTSCGKCVRGLIHRRCNLVLAYARDRVDVLQGLIKYLDRWASRTTPGSTS